MWTNGAEARHCEARSNLRVQQMNQFEPVNVRCKPSLRGTKQFQCYEELPFWILHWDCFGVPSAEASELLAMTRKKSSVIARDEAIFLFRGGPPFNPLLRLLRHSFGWGLGTSRDDAREAFRHCEGRSNLCIRGMDHLNVSFRASRHWEERSNLCVRRNVSFELVIPGIKKSLLYNLSNHAAW